MQFSDHFQNSDTNYIVITSPSVISGVLNNLELTDLSQVKTNIISIGPTTTTAIKKEKGQVFHESKIQNITSLYDDLNHVIGKMHHH